MFLLLVQDSELLEFCTEQLISHLSPKGMRINCTRADEIEYVFMACTSPAAIVHLVPRAPPQLE